VSAPSEAHRYAIHHPLTDRTCAIAKRLSSIAEVAEFFEKEEVS
jgi:hypothetical protein